MLTYSKGRRPPSFDTFHASVGDFVKHDAFFGNVFANLSNEVLVVRTGVDSWDASSVGLKSVFSDAAQT